MNPNSRFILEKVLNNEKHHVQYFSPENTFPCDNTLAANVTLAGFMDGGNGVINQTWLSLDFSLAGVWMCCASVCCGTLCLSNDLTWICV